MFKLLKLLGWLVVALLLLIGVDQFLLRVPLDVPGATQVQTFYVDFRSRLLDLIGIDPTPEAGQKSIEAVIEASQKGPIEKSIPPQRYLYVDGSGDLQFADSLEQVPLRYQRIAKPLAE